MNSGRWTSLLRYHKFYKILCFVLSVGLIILPIHAEQGIANVYHQHENHEMKIALTFDDGPHPILTPKILDILAKYHVKATFFMVGENVKNYPDVVEQILIRGHEIGNHTYTHDHINQKEIEACEKIIYELTDYRTKLFRPPEGAINQTIKYISAGLGYDIILWNIDTRDWDHTSPSDISQNVIKKIDAGSIILMHDYISFNSPTPDALELMIPRLLEMGYQFVVVSELIGTG